MKRTTTELYIHIDYAWTIYGIYVINITVFYIVVTSINMLLQMEKDGPSCRGKYLQYKFTSKQRKYWI